MTSNLLDLTADRASKIALITGVGRRFFGTSGTGTGGIVEKVTTSVKEVSTEETNTDEPSCCGLENKTEESCTETPEKANVSGTGV